MKKNYDIPEILVIIKGGVIQEITIPEDTNIKVKVKDYDVDIDPNSEEAKDYEIREDENGVYEEGIWEN